MDILLVVFEVVWGLLLSLYYSFVALGQWIWPAKFMKSLEGEIVLVSYAAHFKISENGLAYCRKKVNPGMRLLLIGRHDIRHNDTQHDAVMLSVIYAKC